MSLRIFPSSFSSRALRGGQGAGAQILALRKQQVEGEKYQGFGFAVGQSGLQCREVRRAIMVKRADFAVDDTVRQFGGDFGDGGELAGPVQPLAGEELGFAILDPQLHAIAVELHLMHPASAGRRLIHQAAELRFDEMGQFGNFLAFTGSGSSSSSFRLLEFQTASRLESLGTA